MKGKKKLFTMLLAVAAFVITGVAFGLGSTVKNIVDVYADKVEVAGYSQGFTGRDNKPIIFSAEKVYFAKEADRAEKLTYVNGYKFNPIATNTGVKYFGDYGLYGTNAGNYENKSVISSGGFVKLNDVDGDKQSSEGVTVSEGVLVTFGGYYYAVNDKIATNVIEWGDKNGDNVVDSGELTGWDNPQTLPGWKDVNGNGNVDSAELIGWDNKFIVWNDVDENGEVSIGELTGWIDINDDGDIDEGELPGWADTKNIDGIPQMDELVGWIDSDDDGKVDTVAYGGGYYLNAGAEMTYVSVNVKKDGLELGVGETENVVVPSARQYNSVYQDFTWFIDTTKENEGHYMIEISYMIDGTSRKAEFDFYLLLESSYTSDIIVNELNYTPKPTFKNVYDHLNHTETNQTHYYHYNSKCDYPMLTYDYTRYKVSYTHVSGDLHKNVDVTYDNVNQQIVITTTIYDVGTDKKYSVNDFDKGDNADNHILSLMFTENGKYTFNINYMYNHAETNLVIDKTELAFGNMTLDIYGYQLKYSRAGFVSADMTYMEIFQNGTMFILVNGFTGNGTAADGDNLGVNYKLVAPSNKQETGIVSKYETGRTGEFNTIKWNYTDTTIDVTELEGWEFPNKIVWKGGPTNTDHINLDELEGYVGKLEDLPGWDKDEDDGDGLPDALIMRGELVGWVDTDGNTGYDTYFGTGYYYLNNDKTKSIKWEDKNSDTIVDDGELSVWTDTNKDGVEDSGELTAWIGLLSDLPGWHPSDSTIEIGELLSGFTDIDEDGVIDENELPGWTDANKDRVVDINELTGWIDSNDDRLVDTCLYSVGNTKLEAVKYTKTDRGIWLTLNDTYNLTDSKYWYSPTPITSTLAAEASELTKVTTFTTPGYYLVEARYDYESLTINGESIKKSDGLQYFAFQVTSATPQLILRKTEEKNAPTDPAKSTEFYAREYTNQNVFAYWEDRGVFESQILGKLYQSKSERYPTEQDFLDVLNGKVTNSNILYNTYIKNAIITDSDSYMLVLEVVGTATRVYTYFTIDKDAITGLEVYQVTAASIDNALGYIITTNDVGPVTHTGKGAINTSFTIGWADKPSRASISAEYKFTPFILTDTEFADINIDNEKLYVYNGYIVGETSELISIDRPEFLNAILSADNVLTDQGIYEFTITDQAGNKLYYIVIIDRTDVKVTATYGLNIVWTDREDMGIKGEIEVEELSGWTSSHLIGLPCWSDTNKDGKVQASELTSFMDADGKQYGWIDTNDADATVDTYIQKETKYTRGEKVSDPVTAVWGTHKAISLADVKSDVVNSWLDKSLSQDYKDNYYRSNTNNWNEVEKLLTMISGQQVYIMQNMYTEIREMSEENVAYVIDYKGKTTTRYNGMVVNNWNTATNFSNYSNSQIRINVDKDNTRRYTMSVVGGNVVDDKVKVNFNVVITPDKALGSVYSAPANALNPMYDTEVITREATPNVDKDGTDKGRDNNSLTIDVCGAAQASDDGQFVFEWTSPGTTDTFTVTDVVYHYYKLMDYSELNGITSKSSMAYYPYKYSTTKTILKSTKNDGEDGYTVIEKDYNAVSKNGVTINRSNPINLGYETYYEGETLVTKSVTQTGLYIITRTLVTGNDPNTAEKFSYAFFVDRNMIVGYSLANVSEKIVGQFIHASMPTSTITWTDKNKNNIIEANEISGANINIDNLPGWEDGNSDGKIQSTELIGWLDSNGDGKVDTCGGEIHYDNFTKQGLKEYTLNYGYDEETEKFSEAFTYKVYAETNKMPTSIKVPSGKYVSGTYNETNSSIVATSHNTLKLQLSIYFIDSYKILEQSAVSDKATTLKIMNKREYAYDEYINLLFDVEQGMKGIFAQYNNARMHNEDNKLSLPGTYVFVINDLVGSRLQDFKVADYNKFIFGVKLTRQEPNISAYAYAGTRDKLIVGSNTYAVDKVLYTNEEYVSFEINFEDLKAYNAQVDTNNFKIYRSNIDGTDYALWYEKKNGTPVASLNKDIITEKTIDGRTTYIIDLPTGVEVDETTGQIISYEEYIYTIEVQFILTNTASIYYNYKEAVVSNSGSVALGDVQFYKSKYTIHIDRSPDSDNLNTIIKDQHSYFDAYHESMAGKDYVDVNTQFAYRNVSSFGDYYGLANNLYYQYVDKVQHDNASQAMYAITIDNNTTLDLEGLSTIYVRQLQFNSASNNNRRMGLLPVCDTYFGNSSGFHVFNETNTVYNGYSYKVLNDGNRKTYSAVISNGQVISLTGRYYEIVEMDLAGNLTQYVVYFKDSNAEPSLKITGDIINSEDDSATLKFEDSVGTENQKAFTSISNITVNQLIAESYAYYGIINIYNGSNVLEEQIYLNSTSNSIKIGEKVLQVVSGMGSYRVEFVDVYGNTYMLSINKYDSDTYKLNTSAFTYKVGDAGQKYILLSEVNNRLDEKTWWYLTNVEIQYNNNGSKTVKYKAAWDENGNFNVTYQDGYSDTDEIQRDPTALDRLNLADNIQYLIILTDIGGNEYKLTLSTTDGYYPHRYLDLPTNIYQSSDILYTTNDIKVSYNNDFYKALVRMNGSVVAESESTYKSDTPAGSKYTTITLYADIPLRSSDTGSRRDFDVEIRLVTDSIDKPATHIYNVLIDTSCIELFEVSNTNNIDLTNMTKSTFNNNEEFGSTGELREGKYYNQLIAETIEVSWSRKQPNEYFNYTYDLYEFVNQDRADKIDIEGKDSHLIPPKENTTGKYILVINIKSKTGIWIATRVIGIAMSTTITGLYEVRDTNDNICDYASLTNLGEVIETYGDINLLLNNWESLKFSGRSAMENAVTGFGTKTAIKMYISKNKIINAQDVNYAPALVVQHNKDNGVDAGYCELATKTAVIRLYHIFRSNYRTFIVTMEVLEMDQKNSILSQLLFMTGIEQMNQHNLLTSGTSKVVYDGNALYYKLKFNSYNKNHVNTNPLEKHNEIIIDVYYNDSKMASTTIIGDAKKDLSEINFKNSGSYTFEIRDRAGNKQYFTTATSVSERFTLVLMKKDDILYTVNGQAPIQYAFYDKDVEVEIARKNYATGLNNYVDNSIGITVNLNGVADYRGYEHSPESTKYIFKAYGTYVIDMTAKLSGTGEQVSTRLIFTILNPNEARSALDFTSIYGYEIMSVFSVTKTAERDVTNTFVGMLQDKANSGSVDVYNKLITYERLVETFGTATQGKMKFKMLYRVKDDPLLPMREVEFSFTLNNEKPTITCSVKAGEKTTKEVTLKFNAANIYDQVGECNLVVNGQVIMRINEASAGQNATQVVLKEVGEYYVQLVGDSGNVITSFNFTIKEPLNTVAIILIVVIVCIVAGLIGTIIWLRTKMKVR